MTRHHACVRSCLHRDLKLFGAMHTCKLSVLAFTGVAYLTAVNLSIPRRLVAWYLTITNESFLECTQAKYSMRTTVLHINHSVACFNPQVYGKALIMQHRPCSTHDRSVLSLCDPILLWVMRRYELSSNSFCTAKVFEFARDEFTTIISP